MGQDSTGMGNNDTEESLLDSKDYSLSNFDENDPVSFFGIMSRVVQAGK